MSKLQNLTVRDLAIMAAYMLDIQAMSAVISAELAGDKEAREHYRLQAADILATYDDNTVQNIQIASSVIH